MKIFPDDGNTESGERAMSQMPKFSVNEGVWLEVRQFPEGKRVVLDHDFGLPRGQAFDGLCGRRSTLCSRNAAVQRASD